MNHKEKWEKEKWEEEFDEKFSCFCGLFPTGHSLVHNEGNEIKSFISSLLQKRGEEVLELIENIGSKYEGKVYPVGFWDEVREEITTSVSFEGKEAETLQSHEVEIAVRILNDGGSPKITTIFENLSEEKMEQFTKNFEKSESKNAVEMLCGIPILKKKWVPLNEVWMIDKDGKIIRKFKL